MILEKNKRERDLEAQDRWSCSCLGDAGQLGPGLEWFWETGTGWILF